MSQRSAGELTVDDILQRRIGDAATRTCTGCMRTIDEIGAWSRMSPDERREVMATLPDRRKALTKRRGGRAARLASG